MLVFSTSDLRESRRFLRIRDGLVMKNNLSETKVFLFRWQAEICALRARIFGFNTNIWRLNAGDADKQIMLCGRWGVRMEK